MQGRGGETEERRDADALCLVFNYPPTGERTARLLSVSSYTSSPLPLFFTFFLSAPSRAPWPGKTNFSSSCGGCSRCLCSYHHHRHHYHHPRRVHLQAHRLVHLHYFPLPSSTETTTETLDHHQQPSAVSTAISVTSEDSSTGSTTTTAGNTSTSNTPEHARQQRRLAAASIRVQSLSTAVRAAAL